MNFKIRLFCSKHPPVGLLQTDAQEVASVVSAREIQAVAELLQISPEGLQKAITFKVTVSLQVLGTVTASCQCPLRGALSTIL